MTSIRKIRKAFKRKNGIKVFSVHFKSKEGPLRFTPTVRKILRRNVTKLFRNSLAGRHVH